MLPICILDPYTPMFFYTYILEAHIIGIFYSLLRKHEPEKKRLTSKMSKVSQQPRLVAVVAGNWEPMTCQSSVCSICFTSWPLGSTAFSHQKRFSELWVGLTMSLTRFKQGEVVLQVKAPFLGQTKHLNIFPK